MNRRSAIKSVGILMGTAFAGSNFFISGCADFADKTLFFSKKEIDFLNKIADVIIPPTNDSGGGKDANIGSFINIIARDCLKKNEQDLLKKGIVQLNKLFKNNIDNFSSNQQYEMLSAIDKEATNYEKTKNQDADLHYFTIIKQLTIKGFFTSEAGSHAQRYVPVPGYYDGAMDYKNGDKNFGPT